MSPAPTIGCGARAPRPGLALAAGLAVALASGCETVRVVAPVLPPLSGVMVSPATDTLRVGDSRLFTAVALDTLGQPVAGAAFAWTSTDPSVFTVSSIGRVTAVGEGIASLVVEAGGHRDSASIFVYPDVGWFVQASRTSANLNGVFFQPNGRAGVAVGDGGTIVRTTDAGASWASRPSGTAYNLNAVWFPSPATGFAVGNSGTILRSDDGGHSWRRVPWAGGENLFDVTFAGADTGWIVGSAGAILRTVDGGAIWQKRQVTGFALRTVAFAGPHGWAAGDGGVLFGTDDAGAHWLEVHTITSQALRGLARRSADAAWAVGDQGVALRTLRVGDRVLWHLENLGALNQLAAVHFPTADTGWIVGFSGSGLILRSDDAGATWERQVSRTGSRLNDVFFVDDQRGWAVGRAGAIVHTARGGRR